MWISKIKQELIDNGNDPDDFNIITSEKGHSVTPKWFYEKKQIAKKEDEPIKEDVDSVALTSAYVLEDTMAISETVAFLLVEISRLKAEIESLKGGNN